MTLPRGVLQTFVVRSAAEAEPTRALPVSFDQRRHVGEGERPGSWMAIALRVPADVPPDRIAQAWMAVVARHGALNSVFSRGDGGDVILKERRTIGIGWRRHPIVDGTAARDALRMVLDEACTSFASPSHRLALVTPEADETGDPRPVVIIASDHAHVDMWSLLILARDLRAGLDAHSDDTPPAASSAVPVPVPSFADHSAVLERMPPAPEHVAERWREILDEGDGLMPRFPLPLGDVSHPRPEVVEVHDVLDSAQLAGFERVAADSGVRATALALSVIASVTRRMADAPLRSVFPVHSRHEPRWHDSVGWFITNSVIECREASPAACATAVKEALVLGSHPLAPIFAPLGGMPATPGMFAISWLDTRRLPLVPADLSIQFVSAVILTDGVMVWFVINDRGLHLRCRYPETPEARSSVGAWLDEVRTGLREAAVR